MKTRVLPWVTATTKYVLLGRLARDDVEEGDWRYIDERSIGVPPPDIESWVQEAHEEQCKIYRYGWLSFNYDFVIVERTEVKATVNHTVEEMEHRVDEKSPA